MRWESSRMMLPEHVQALRKLARENMKICKPQLDEQKWEEIERVIQDAARTNESIDINYFHDGAIHQITRCSVSIDLDRQQLHFHDQLGTLQNISIQSMVDVRFSN
jgi:hypothetical protein